MSSADGEELASSSEEVEIGRTDGTIIHEITTLTAIEKGGMDLLNAWAADENLTILVDLLPGFFGPEYQMSILPMSVSCETAEYLPGRIKTEKGMRSRGQSVNSRSICNSRKP